MRGKMAVNILNSKHNAMNKTPCFHLLLKHSINKRNYVKFDFIIGSLLVTAILTAEKENLE